MNTKPPLTLHEDLLDKFIERDPQTGAAIEDEALDCMRAGLKTARAAAEQVAAVIDALANDATGTHAGKAREITLKAGERGAQALDHARDAALREIAAIEAETAAPPEPANEIELGVESQIRDRLAAMDDKTRTETINAALASGDDRTLGAILRHGVPAWLSGLSPAELEMRRETWRQKRYFAESRRLARLRRAVEVTEIAGKSFVAFIRQTADSPGAKIAEATERSRAAIEAAEKNGEAA